MEENNKTLTVSVSRITDIQDFLEYCSLLCGSARLIQGKTNIPASSRLGIISLCDGTPFNIVFSNCSDNEIDRFKRFEYHEPIKIKNDIKLTNSNIEDYLNITFDYNL